MFQKETLIRHYVFAFVDVISLLIAFILANIIRFHKVDLADHDYLYVKVFGVAVLGCIIGNRLLHLYHRIFDRGLYEEFLAVVKSTCCVGIVIITFLFFSQEGINYSRLLMIYSLPIYMLVSYGLHILIKPLIAVYYRNSRSFKQIMLISSLDKVESILEKFETTNNWYFKIAYIVLVDQDRSGEQIHNIPVVSDLDNMMESAKNIALDGVFINVSDQCQGSFNVRKTLHDFQSMGVPVHVNIDALELDVTDKKIENLGFFKVVSYVSKIYEPGQLVAKRLIDIAGGIVGMLITVIVGIFLVPIIKLDSPGPAIYSQYRVGRNGHHFKMYKFRSMYIDADERKKELEQQNEMSGAMFKIANDPRITRVGKWIRKYSLDELPQFWNVLKGDMSLVGTRPPTVEEVEKYRVEQKRRLSLTPGMTGLWQTSGRNEIYDFEEIVKLDLEYIDHWSVGLDIKLIIKTIMVCFSGRGAT